MRRKDIRKSLRRRLKKAKTIIEINRIQKAIDNINKKGSYKVD